MRVGDMVKLLGSTHKNGLYAGKIGLIVDLDPYDNPIINVGGEVVDFHYTQVEKVFGTIGKVTNETR